MKPVESFFFVTEFPVFFQAWHFRIYYDSNLK